MDRFETDLTDEERAVIEPLIPPPSRMGRPRELDMREVFNAVQFILGTGCQWRALPKCFPPFTSVQNHFCPWCRTGVLERMPDALRTLARELEGRSPEPAAAAIDSQPSRPRRWADRRDTAPERRSRDGSAISRWMWRDSRS